MAIATLLVIGFITLITSTITAVIGLGGGLLLIAIIPLFLPTNIVIPIHGITQLASNISRAFFAKKYIQWSVFYPYFFGGILGASVFAIILKLLSFDYIPLFIGVYIILSQWSELFNRIIQRFENFTLLGFFQVGLGIIVGSPGPIHIALLSKRYKNKNVIVATAAALVTTLHTLKVVVFIILGINLWQYGQVILTMVIAAIAGSFIGTKLRGKLDSNNFTLILKIVLSILAIKMIISVFYG